MGARVSGFVMFQDGRAGEAAEAYAAAFGAPAPEAAAPGLWVLRLPGMELRLFDSPMPHEFGITPAVSLFVTCDEAAEVDRLAEALGTEGQVMMPLDSYDFSPRFCWLADRFGVSWQIAQG
jgi:predicted 3-demethylubiquinone-9 3-methyltransferase (glyoxalase superfamily)